VLEFGKNGERVREKRVSLEVKSRAYAVPYFFNIPETQ